MLKILTNKQIREVDLATIQAEAIQSETLMERAGIAFFECLFEQLDPSKQVYVFAGVGNNGGDALVIARYLHITTFDVRVFILGNEAELSSDCFTNLLRARERKMDVVTLTEMKDWPFIPKDTLIVDGIFGSGLNRPVDGFLKDCILKINESGAEVVSIDLPSGMLADASPSFEMTIVKANQTIAFEIPKPVFFMPDCYKYVGDWKLVNIGLNKKFIEEVPCSTFLVDKIESRFLESFLRKKFTHKGTFGHALIVAGCRGKMGAAVLCTQAAMRAGAGLTTVGVPRCGEEILQISASEAMCAADSELDFMANQPDLKGMTSVGVGPGLGQNASTKKMLQQLLSECEVPVVLDADALNLISSEAVGLKWIKPNSILTPHIKEFERLFGTSKNDLDRIELLRTKAKEYKIFIILKGAHSALATPSGEVYFNNTGNPGMATGGSGDVLTGIVTGLLAQSKNPFYSGLVGVYLHGRAGDLAVKESGQLGLIASDIIRNIAPAMSQLMNQNQ